MPVFSVLVSLLRARRAFRPSFLPLLLAALLLPTAALWAQTATFSGAPSLVNGIGNLYPTGVAVDAAGYIYVANGPGGSTSTEILKITPGGGSSVLNLSGYTLRAAFGLAVDSAGYLYIVDSPLDGYTADNRVLKVKTDGTSASVIPAGTLNEPTAVTVDTAGNVYITDYNGTNGRVVKVPYSSGTYGAAANFVSTTESIGSGGALQYGAALAIDTSGDVLLTDISASGGARLIKVTSSGAATELISYIQSIGTGGTLYTPNGVAADAQGDIFIADQEANDGLGRIVELPYSAGSYGSPIEYVPSTTNTLAYPNGLAIDSKGNLYATDYGSDAKNPTGTGGVIEIATQSTDFGSIAVGSGSATYSLNFVFDTAASLNGTTPYKVLTLGTSGLDFAVVTSGTSCSGSFSAGGTCTVKVKFTPRYAGLRTGAVVLLNGSGGIIATAHVRGTGTGPQVVFSPEPTSALGGGFNGATGVAVDGGGNVYVADSNNNAVKEMAAGCASSACVSPLGGGFSGPTGVAVDGSGNVYVADQSTGTVVKEMPAGCASSACVKTLGGGFYYPDGLTVDGSGNVYVADSSNSLVKEMPAGCASSSCVTTLGVGFSFGAPTGVAVDPSGNVYVADQGNTAVYEISASCIAGANNASCVTSMGGGSFSSPYGVSVDGGGNLYVADWGDSAVKELPGNCVSSSCVTTLSTGFSSVTGVAVDGSGNVYAADNDDASVVELDRSNAPSLSFGSITAGQTSSSQTVTLENIGNAALTLPVPTSGNNPSVAANFNLTGATTCPEIDTSSSAGTLAAGASCELVVDFAPTDTGSIAGSVVVKDNHLNAVGPNYTTQSITLSGTGSAVVPGAPTIGTVTAGNTQVTVSFNPPASDGGATITSYAATSSPGGTTAICASSPCVVTGLTNGTAYTFTVTATNSVGTGPASAASASVTPKASQTITFSNPGTQNFGTSPTLTATATSGLTVTFTSSTTAVCTVTTGGSLTFVTAGTCTINADQAGNGAYHAASTVTQSFTVAAVVPGAPTIGTATAGNTQVTVSFTAPAFTGGAAITGYTATSNPGGLTGTCAASPCVVTGLTNGTAYTFTVTATNSTGTGSASAASGSVTPRGSQTITFNNPGAQNFGTSPTLVATATSGLTVTFSSGTTGVCIVTSGGALTFESAGTCTINADQAGNGAYAAAPTVTRSFTIAAVAPGAPTIVAATAGEEQATVNFTAPVFTGGLPITGYTATSSPSGTTGTCASSPCVVTGLKAGTSYTFTVTATNGAGTGLASAASNAVTTPVPNLVVTTAADDAGAASSCTPQSSAGTGTDAACSLRDALLYAASAGAANISFDSTKFATATTITLGSGGTLTIPDSTTITGPTSGSGYNLVTVSGANTYQIFTSSGTATVSGLTVQNGSSSNGGGAFLINNGALTLRNCTIQNNAIASGSSGYGGAIQANGNALVIDNCTFTGNIASPGVSQAGAIYVSNGILTINNSTFYSNFASEAGVLYFAGNAGTITNSTFASNSAATFTAVLETQAPVTLNNNIFSNNSSGGEGTIRVRDENGGTISTNSNVFFNNTLDFSCQSTGNSSCSAIVSVATVEATANPVSALSNFGGPTQTMVPLPGGGAICAGLSTLIPSGITTDQRGEPNTNASYPGYSSGAPCVDAGAVQSNYSIGFTQQPTDVLQNAAILPAPSVTLKESGSAFTASSVAIPLSLTTGSGALSGSSASTSAGVATYSGLSVSAAGTGDVLTATLSLNPSSALSLTAASNSFNVMPTIATVTGVSPSIGPFAGGTTVTITGTNFTGATSVLFGSTPASSFTVNSATQITATAPAGSAGTVEVTVATAAGTSATSAADQFTYLVPPSISVSLSSASVVLGTPATLTFTLTNSNSATSLTGVTFSNSLPSGVVFATPANLMNTCGGTAASTGTTITLSAATLSSGVSCNVTVQITSNTAGSYTDTTSTVTSTQTAPGTAGNATLTVTAATVTASITAADKTYDGSNSATITRCTLTGVLAADVGNVSCSASGASFASSGAANGITVMANGISLSGSAAGNYTLAATTATTTANITQAPLTVTASNTSTTYGTAPSVTPAYSAFAGSDTAAGLTTAPRCVSTITASTPVGSYTGANSCVGAVDANYSFTYVAGNATVTQATQTIHFTALSSPVVYGVLPITLSATATSGSAVSFSVVSGPGTISGNTLTISGAGTIVIAANQDGNTNYVAAAQVTQSVAVTEAPLAITASGASMIYGATVPTITASYAGFVGNDSVASLTTQPTCSTTATSHSPAGSYPSSCSGAVDANYSISYTAGSVIVGRAALTIAANNATKTYGTTNPTFTGSVTGAESGDTFTESFSTTAMANSNVGTYVIVPSAAGLDLGDYTETIQNGTLTVTQASSAVALTSSSANANLNADVTFTATVTSATTGTPSGAVEFLDGSTVLGTETLNSAGVATFTTANLSSGPHTLNAVYAGDQNFTASSTALVQQVTGPDYSLTANPASLTLKAGQTGQVTFTFVPMGGYTGTINFACSGLPANASCSFAPSSLTANGSNHPQTLQLTITTEGPNSGTVAGNESRDTGGVAAASISWLPGLLLGCFLLCQRKKMAGPTQRLLGTLIFVAAICRATGCGFAPPRTPGGSQAVTVTATATASASGSGLGSSSGATSHTATFVLTITQ